MLALGKSQNPASPSKRAWHQHEIRSVALLGDPWKPPRMAFWISAGRRWSANGRNDAHMLKWGIWFDLPFLDVSFLLRCKKLQWDNQFGISQINLPISDLAINCTRGSEAPAPSQLIWLSAVCNCSSEMEFLKYCRFYLIKNNSLNLIWHTTMKHFKSELVQDQERTTMDVNRINFYANFKWSFSDFIANGLQIFTLDWKWAGDSMTTCTACCIRKYLFISIKCFISLSYQPWVYYTTHQQNKKIIYTLEILQILFVLPNSSEIFLLPLISP